MGSTWKAVLWIVLLVGVISVASYLAVKRTKPDEEAMGYGTVLMCSNPGCEKIFEGNVIAGQPPPFQCKRCGKKTAYRALRCSDCGSIFPNIVQEDPTKPESEEIRTTECPYCRSRDIGLVQSMDEIEKPAPAPE